MVEGLGPITMPTMYVWSTEDIALGREAAEATADAVDGPYRFEVLEGISHWVAEQAPDRLNELLLDHVKSG
jgi:pimeloyl-ACP methyl ester carboxylesterase